MLPHPLRGHPAVPAACPLCHLITSSTSLHPAPMQCSFIWGLNSNSRVFHYSMRYSYLIRCPIYHNPHFLSKNHNERNFKPMGNFQVLILAGHKNSSVFFQCWISTATLRKLVVKALPKWLAFSLTVFHKIHGVFFVTQSNYREIKTVNAHIYIVDM